jgi:hypothetical protein
MIRKRSLPTVSLLGSLAGALMLCVPPAHAATIWTDWTSATNGSSSGSAFGTVGGVGVSYSGQLNGFVINGTSTVWLPSSSFIGGTVTTSPSVMGDELRLIGSPNTSPITDTITFSSPVDNPLIAIWSLGSPLIGATFTFDATPTLEAGGPNSAYGGSSITVAGNVVSGHEGNGVIQFDGTFSSITFTSTPENFYSFTVGINGPPGPSTVPEPASAVLAAVGVGLLGVASRGRKQRLSR